MRPLAAPLLLALAFDIATPALSATPFGLKRSSILTADVSSGPASTLLVLSSVALLLALVTISSDAFLGSRVRSPPTRRGAMSIAIPRVLFAAVALAVLVVGFIELNHGLRAPILAGSTADRIVTTLVARALAASTNASFVPAKGLLGVGERVGEGLESGAKAAWTLLAVAIGLITVCGAVVGVFAERAPVKRGVFLVAIAQVAIWTIITLVVTFVQPSGLLYHDNALGEQYWLRDDLDGLNGEPAYIRFWSNTQPPIDLNVTRLLRSWYVKVVADDVETTRQVITIGDVAAKKRLELEFCSRLNILLPQSNTSSTAKIGVTDDIVFAKPVSGKGLILKVAEPVMILARQAQTKNITVTVAASSTTSKAANNVGTETATKNAATRAPAISKSSEATASNTTATTADMTDTAGNGTDTSPTTAILESNYGTLPKNLSRETFSKIIMTYVIGKPLGRDQYHGLGYLSLPYLALSPPLVAQVFVRRYTAPLFLLFLAVPVIIAVVGAPAPLIKSFAPKEASQLVALCGNTYRVHVTPNSFKLTTYIERAVIALAAVVAIVRAFAWLSIADRANREALDRIDRKGRLPSDDGDATFVRSDFLVNRSDAGSTATLPEA
jgi:hypothetical protein